jgi:transcriptional regulator with XRE-family HTH domain
MENMSKRIVELREKLGLTQVQFAKKIGVSSQLINMIEAGKSSLTEPNIRLIIFTFGVNEEWFREGKGEILIDEAFYTEYERYLLDLFRQLSPRARKFLIEYAEKLLSDEAALKGEAEAAEKGENLA